MNDMCTETCTGIEDSFLCEGPFTGSARDHWWAGPPPEEPGEIDAQRWDVYGNENNILDAIGTIGTTSGGNNDYTHLDARYYHGGWEKGANFGSFYEAGADGGFRWYTPGHRTHPDYDPGAAQRQGNPSLGDEYTRLDPSSTNVFGSHDMGQGTNYDASYVGTDTWSWPDMGAGGEFSLTTASWIIQDYNDFSVDGVEDCWALVHRSTSDGASNPFLESRDCNNKMYGVCMVMPVPRKDRGCARVGNGDQHEAGNADGSGGFGRQLNAADEMLAKMGGDRAALKEEWRKELGEFEKNETERVEREYQDKMKQYSQFKRLEAFVGSYLKWREDPANKELVEEEELQRQSIKKRYEAMSKMEQKQHQRVLSMDEAYEEIVDFMKPRTEEEFRLYRIGLQARRNHRQTQEKIKEDPSKIFEMFEMHKRMAARASHEARVERYATEPSYQQQPHHVAVNADQVHRNKNSNASYWARQFAAPDRDGPTGFDTMFNFSGTRTLNLFGQLAPNWARHASDRLEPPFNHPEKMRLPQEKWGADHPPFGSVEFEHWMNETRKSDAYKDAYHRHMAFLMNDTMPPYPPITPTEPPPTTPPPTAPPDTPKRRQLEDGHPFPEIAQRVRERKLLTRAPGEADGTDHLPSHVQLLVADLDGNGFDDLIAHSPGTDAGDCAMRCLVMGRFGFPSFDLSDADDPSREGRPYCYWYDLSVGMCAMVRC